MIRVALMIDDKVDSNKNLNGNNAIDTDNLAIDNDDNAYYLRLSAMPSALCLRDRLTATDTSRAFI